MLALIQTDVANDTVKNIVSDWPDDTPFQPEKFPGGLAKLEHSLALALEAVRKLNPKPKTLNPGT